MERVTITIIKEVLNSDEAASFILLFKQKTAVFTDISVNANYNKSEVIQKPVIQTERID